MLVVLKNKKVLIGIIAAIIFIGTVGIICWIGNSDKNGSDVPDEITEVLPDGAQGLEVEDNDDKDDKESSVPSIDAPSSWEDGENTQTENSNSNTENKNENVGNKEETEQNGNVSDDDSLEDDDTSYGEIL